MKTLAEIRNEWQERQRSRMVFSNGFRRQLMEDGWCRLKRDDEVIEGEYYGTADGLVKIMKKTENKEEWWGKIIKPSHGQTKEGDVFCYGWDELFVGQHKNKDKWQVASSSFCPFAESRRVHLILYLKFCDLGMIDRHQQLFSSTLAATLV